MASPNAYFLCTAPRSGSTLLCKMLAATGIAGAPKSWFHRPRLRDWARSAGLDPDEEPSVLRPLIFARMQDMGRGHGDLFGLRLQRHSFSFFMAQLALLAPEQLTEPGRIEAVFGNTRYIYLNRQDKVAQAVSYIRASQSGLWHRKADGSDLERLEPEEPAGFDAQTRRL